MAGATPGAASAVPLRVTTSVLVLLCDVASVLTRHTPLHHSLQTPMPLCPYGADRRWEIAVAAEGDTTAAQRHEDLAALPVATTAPADAELAKEDTYLQCPYCPAAAVVEPLCAVTWRTSPVSAAHAACLPLPPCLALASVDEVHNVSTPVPPPQERCGCGTLTRGNGRTTYTGRSVIPLARVVKDKNKGPSPCVYSLPSSRSGG